MSSYYDQNLSRYVGYNTNYGNYTNTCLETYFSDQTVRLISQKITELLKGYSDNPIVVSDKDIIDIMNAVQLDYRPPTGDIFSRYTIGGMNSSDYVQNMIDQTIEIITSQIKAEIDTEKTNRSLSIWNTVYGEHNTHGLMSHSTIKIREKRPNTFQFHMRY